MFAVADVIDVFDFTKNVPVLTVVFAASMINVFDDPPAIATLPVAVSKLAKVAFELTSTFAPVKLAFDVTARSAGVFNVPPRSPEVAVRVLADQIPST